MHAKALRWESRPCQELTGGKAKERTGCSAMGLSKGTVVLCASGQWETPLGFTQVCGYVTVAEDSLGGSRWQVH